MTNTVVNANLYRIVARMVSREETRYYLNGVCIEPFKEGVLMIATDGHRMLVAYDKAGTTDERKIVRLPNFAMAHLKGQKQPLSRDQKRLLEVDGTVASIVDVTAADKSKPEKRETHLSFHGVIIDGTFPDWRRVMPKGETKPEDVRPSTFMDKYIKEWGAIGVELGGGMHQGVQFSLSTGGDPVVVRFNGREDVFGIQMPFRSDIKGFLPAFMDA